MPKVDKKVATVSARYVRELLLRTAASDLVTPFTGFVLSEAFLSQEVEKYRIGYLNPRARNLAYCRDFRGITKVFVQVDQLEQFEAQILPRMREPFTLITGKWNLPGLTMSRAVESLLGHPLVTAWFSQNQVYSDLPIIPFPYGMNLSSAPSVWLRSRRVSFQPKRDEDSVFVPNCAIYSEGHSPKQAHDERIALEPLMSERMPLPTYLRNIRAHKYVACPPGDRYDTYRHWETIALGAIPITIFPEKFRDLFGGSVVETEHIASTVGNIADLQEPSPQPSLATVRYWRERLANVR